ncbi:MAG: hypothetical protein ACJAZ3_000777 [Sphingobacteriales bacterium]|jgi:hypothetical protein
MDNKEKHIVDKIFTEKLKGYSEAPDADFFDKLDKKINPSSGFWGSLPYYSKLILITLIAFTGITVSVFGVRQYSEKINSINPIQESSTTSEVLDKTREPISEATSTGLTLADTTKVVKISVVDSPKNGLLEFSSQTGEFNYQPYKDFFGIDSFTFSKIFSNGEISAPMLISIVIDPEIIISPSFEYQISETGQVVFTNTSTFLCTDKSIKKIEQFSWDLGDGTKSTKTTITHQYVEKDEYEICLSATLRDVSETSCLSLNTNNPTNTETKKGKANQKIALNLGKVESPLKLSNKPVNISETLNLGSLNDLKIVAIGRNRTAIIDTSENDNTTSFNNQPQVKKK